MKLKNGLAIAGAVLPGLLGYWWNQRPEQATQARSLAPTREPLPKNKAALERDTSPGRAEPTQSVVIRPNSDRQTTSVTTPNIPYDTSVPLRRAVGETVMMVPEKSWRNVGRATLADAIQTQFWAIAGGNVEELESGITLETTARATLAKLVEGAPESVRAQYGSPEKFAAFLLASSFQDLRGFTLDRQRPISESETIATISTITPDQDRFQVHTEHFRKTSDGAWRRVITSKMAASWGAQYASGASRK